MVVVQEEPAGHCEQEVAPASAYYSVPVPEQAMGRAVFVGHLDPAGHCVHTASPASEYQPDEQATGAADTLEQEEPAGHCEQVVEPAKEYCSIPVPEQGIGKSVLVGHLEPAGH